MSTSKTTSTVENTALRLKAILEILAAANGKVARSSVLEAAFEQFPLDEHESKLLAGDVPRGEKSLILASGKLVKAGWIVKAGRSGWSITDTGRSILAEKQGAAAIAATLQQNKSAPLSESEIQEVAAEADIPVAPAGSDSASAPSVPQPDAVAVAGDFNQVLGCPANWMPDCDQSQLSLDPSDQIWKLTAELPAGTYSYKAALNRSWADNYGADAAWDGPNITFKHDGGSVTFLYHHESRSVRTA